MRVNLAATLVAVALCMLTGTTMAASTQTLSTGVSLWRGTSKLSDSSNRVVDPATKVLTVLTPENCLGIRDRIIQQDALTRTTGTATYRCQVDLRAVVTFVANPTCPPLPPPDGRVVDCPTGYAGAYTQTLSYTAVRLLRSISTSDFLDVRYTMCIASCDRNAPRTARYDAKQRATRLLGHRLPAVTRDAQADEVIVCSLLTTLCQRRPVIDVLCLLGNALVRTALAQRITPQLGVSSVLPARAVIEALADSLVCIPAGCVLPAAVC